MMEENRLQTSGLSQGNIIDLDIVVSKYSSDEFKYITEAIPDANIFIYDKSGREGIKTENKGREGYVYLTHIIQNYEKLARNTLFLQDDCGNHIPSNFDFIAKVLTLSTSENVWLHQFPCSWRRGGKISRRTIIRGICKLHTLENPEAIRISCERLGLNLPEEYTTETCAFFLASRKSIQAHPREFYAGAMEWLLERQSHEFVLEHLWKVILERPMIEKPK